MTVKRSVVAVLFFAVLGAPAFCYTVLWDVSHGVADMRNGMGGYQPDGHYAMLTAHLEDSGFTVNTTSLGFTDNNLDATDVAVVCIASAFDSPYSSAEAGRLAAFVADGGGLLIMGGHPFLPGDSDNIQPVADRFGITLAVGSATFSGLYKPDASEHPVFAGFAETDHIFTQAAGEITVGAYGFALAQEPATGQIFIAGANFGTGRVVTLGDFNMFSQVANTFSRAKNPEFALNTFNWLAVPEPATILLLAAGATLLRRKG